MLGSATFQDVLDGLKTSHFKVNRFTEKNTCCDHRLLYVLLAGQPYRHKCSQLREFCYSSRQSTFETLFWHLFNEHMKHLCKSFSVLRCFVDVLLVLRRAVWRKHDEVRFLHGKGRVWNPPVEQAIQFKIQRHVVIPCCGSECQRHVVKESLLYPWHKFKDMWNLKGPRAEILQWKCITKCLYECTYWNCMYTDDGFGLFWNGCAVSGFSSFFVLGLEWCNESRISIWYQGSFAAVPIQFCLW